MVIRLFILPIILNFFPVAALAQNHLIASGRESWGWGNSSITTFLDKIASLLTFLTFGLFLLNLLLNALLFGGLLPTATGTGTSTGGTSTMTGGTSTAPTGLQTGGGGPLVSINGNGAGGLGVNLLGSGPTLTGIGTGDGGISIGRSKPSKMSKRGKRSTMQLNLDPVTLSNGMAESLLTLMGGIWEDTDNRCLPTLLCQLNRRTTLLAPGTLYAHLMPLCSMSSLLHLKEGQNNFHYLNALEAIYEGQKDNSTCTEYSICNNTDRDPA